MSDLEAFQAELDANRERIARRRAENPEAAARRYAYLRRQVTEDLKRQQAEQRRRQKAELRARFLLWYYNHPLVKAWRER